MAQKLVKWFFKHDRAFLVKELSFNSLFPALFLLMAVNVRLSSLSFAELAFTKSIRNILIGIMVIGLVIDYYFSFARFAGSGIHTSLILLRFPLIQRLSIFYVYNLVRIFAVSLGTAMLIGGWYSLAGFLLPFAAHIALPFLFQALRTRNASHKKHGGAMAAAVTRNRIASIFYVSIFATDNRISIISALLLSVAASVYLPRIKIPLVFINYITSWLVTATIYDLALADEAMYELNVLLRKDIRCLCREKTFIGMVLIAFFTALNVVIHLAVFGVSQFALSDILWLIWWLFAFGYMAAVGTHVAYKDYPDVLSHRGKFLAFAMVCMVPFFNVLICTLITAKEVIAHVHN